MVYSIFCRYEYIGNNGKQFTDYYRYGETFNNEEDVKKKIKELIDSTKSIDKITKLKHEYKYEYVDETLFPQINLKRPKGRPKKFKNEELDIIIKILNKNGKIKIDDNIKGFLYNDNEAKEYISNHIKDNSKYTHYWYDDNYNLFIILKEKN